MFTATQNLFLDSSRTKVLKEGDAKAAFLLTTKDAPVSDEDVKKYKLDAYIKELNPRGGELSKPKKKKASNLDGARGEPSKDDKSAPKKKKVIRRTPKK